MRVTHAINSIYKLTNCFELIFDVFLYKKLLSDQDFMIVINTNFLTAMHGFRDNEVLLPTGYDVIVISPLGAFKTGFVNGI